MAYYVCALISRHREKFEIVTRVLVDHRSVNYILAANSFSNANI